MVQQRTSHTVRTMNGCIFRSACFNGSINKEGTIRSGFLVIRVQVEISPLKCRGAEDVDTLSVQEVIDEDKFSPTAPATPTSPPPSAGDVVELILHLRSTKQSKIESWR